MDTDPEKQLNLVQNREIGRALLDHPRHKLVKDTEGAFYYEDPGGKYRILQGLLPRLKSLYWPTGSYKNLQKKTKGIVKRTKKRRGRGRFQGLIRGKEVHKQLKDFVQLDGKNFAKRHPNGLHDYTERVLKAMVGRMGLRVFVPEMPIYDEVIRVGTAVDKICLDKDGNLVLLEFKTGYKDYFYNQDGFMRHSLKEFANSMKNRATLQLASAALILEKAYQIPLSKMRLYVIRVDDETLDIVPVPIAFVETIGPSVYEDLLKADTDRLKKKMKKKAGVQKRRRKK